MNLENIKSKFQDSENKFSIKEACALANEIFNGRNLLETTDRFHGVFFYEIVPIITIAEYLKEEVSNIQFVGNRERFDGILHLSDGREQKIEMVAAIDGRNDALQIELVKNRGCAPAYQKIAATGTKRNRTFGENELFAQKAEDIDYKILYPLMKSALHLKNTKSTENPDYKGAWLGVVFDDYIQPNLEKKKQRFDPLCHELLQNSQSNFSSFSRTFFVGVSRQYVFGSMTYPQNTPRKRL